MCPFYTSPPKCIHVSSPICSCYSKSLPGHAEACVLMRETQEGMPKKSASLSKKIFFQLMAHRKRCLLPAFTDSPIYDEYRTQLAKVLTLPVPCKNGLPRTTPMIPPLETVTCYISGLDSASLCRFPASRLIQKSEVRKSGLIYALVA